VNVEDRSSAQEYATIVTSMEPHLMFSGWFVFSRVRRHSGARQEERNFDCLD
jgi:hypothetical protein